VVPDGTKMDLELASTAPEGPLYNAIFDNTATLCTVQLDNRFTDASGIYIAYVQPSTPQSLGFATQAFINSIGIFAVCSCSYDRTVATASELECTCNGDTGEYLDSSAFFPLGL
jgi:hypothetical protein